MQDEMPHPSYKRHKKGLLLLNLGTPDAPTPKAVSRYLAEFLSDKRVVEIPHLLWKPLLHGVILPIRSKKSAHNYEKIWDKERNDSPLRLHMHDITTQLQSIYQTRYVMKYALRYGNPSITSIMQEFTDEKISHIDVLPLYPQYCAATTASAYDAIFKFLQKQRWQLSISMLPTYYDHPAYITAICSQLKQYLKNKKPEVFIISFHGMPKRSLMKGDPYYCQVRKTTRLIKEKMNFKDDEFYLGFQSRFGPDKWFSPSVENVMETLIENGKKHIAVIAPGFSVDCVETLEEINISYREYFMNLGGKQFDYIPCLNDGKDGLTMLQKIIDG